MEKAHANEVAEAMMNWAMERGATNYAHWFSPVRGANGLKLDAFIDLDFSDSSVLKPIVAGDFSGGKLFFNETDGSSFPNGGLRATHTAAAFMSWDRGSAPFVRNDTLYIPAAFIAHNGAALDEKTPLLRSQEAINTAGTRFLKALGDTEMTQVVSNVGWEQEFFVIDRDDYLARPDLMATGRTLVGADPPRGQQTDFNYFNKMNPRVREYLKEVQERCWEAGMALSVMHNEVAPSQHEFSPIFSLTNVATDQNTLSMELLEDVAAQHGLVCLMHEKPFAGINGSGKHNNWGLNTDAGRNLYVPGKTALDQQIFIASTAALARALHLHGDTIRVGVATAGNDHRLGAQEAPPAIMSLYTGPGLEAQLKSVMDGGALEGYAASTKDVPSGTKNVQTIAGNVEDRNRTAPFPFCGNRFEFRAVGSTQNIALPLALLNTAVAQSMEYMAAQIESGKSARDVVAEVLKEHEAIIFNGDGYSQEWQDEAAKRGLPNLKNTVDAVDTFASAKNKELFSSMNVFSEAELEARQETMYEQYTNAITIESDCLLKMMKTGALPACATDLNNMAGAGLEGDRPTVYKALDAATTALQAAHDGLPEDDAATAARYCAEVIKPAMDAVREQCDAAEGLCQSEIWPFPHYADMLFAHHTDA